MNNNSRIRLNRYIAMCGICSRRKADEYIQEGLVSVNNKKTTNLGVKITLEDKVFFRGKKIIPEKKQYILLNKPRGYITTMNDERGRKTVLSLVSRACPQRLVPVGRLDRETTGLLLFTNDGKLAKKLTHPSHEIQKTYRVFLDKKLKALDFQKIKKGLILNDGLAPVDSLRYIDETNQLIEITIHIGRNRIVRRMFDFLGYSIKKLDRIGYAGLCKKMLLVGQWRLLTKQELKALNK